VLQRIAVLDLLRGLAIFGMFVVHLDYFRRTPSETGPDPAAFVVERTIDLFFEGQFYAVFCVLFGVGFAVQLARADARGDHFAPRYLRRLFALAVFGFIADGVFRYNVLFVQAVWGLPLLFVRRWSMGALIGLLMLCAASRPLYDLARIGFYSTRPNGIAQLVAANQEATRQLNEVWARVEAAEKSGNWRTVIAGRMEFMPEYYRRSIFLPAQNFTLSLVGMILFRLGLLYRPERHRQLIASFMIGGAVSWAVATWALPIGGPPTSPSDGGAILHAATTLARTNAFMLVREQWLIFTYIGAILLLVVRDVAWLRRFALLGWAGRMALTNYVMHVILLELLFAPHGFGLGLSAPMVFVAATLLFTAQAMVSRWWLMRFTLGPLEWVWRWFTYWKRPALRREAPLLAPAVVAA
jgi:uncharacterized protein